MPNTTLSEPFAACVVQADDVMRAGAEMIECVLPAILFASIH